jgi:hypothetical protein
MHNRILIPLEFGHIGQPFLVWSIGMEFARKNVFCGVLRILRTSGAAVAAVFNGGFNALLSAYPKDTLVIYMNAVVVPKVIVYAAIALVRAFIVDFFHQFSNGFVFPNPVADLPSCPFVIG